MRSIQRKQHFTQEPSQLRTYTHADARRPVLHVHGGGFVTRDMVARTLRSFPGDDFATKEILVDLRDVAGYDQAVLPLADAWLKNAHRQGVRRIAFVANSAVVRTATELASENADVTLRTFADRAAAKAWLG